jgi:hypothetical protein
LCANNDNHIGAKKDSGINKKQGCTGNNIEAALHPIIVVKNARVRARAEVSRYNAIPFVVCGDGNCNCYPRGLSSGGPTTKVFRG